MSWKRRLRAVWDVLRLAVKAEEAIAPPPAPPPVQPLAPDHPQKRKRRAAHGHAG